jgi:hypothetical protein
MERVNDKDQKIGEINKFVDEWVSMKTMTETMPQPISSVNLVLNRYGSMRLEKKFEQLIVDKGKSEDKVDAKRY